MGFNKRYITKDIILSCNSFEQLSRLFKADALILDMWSSYFYKIYEDSSSYKSENFLEFLQDCEIKIKD
jgi:hypothetical protein